MALAIAPLIAILKEYRRRQAEHRSFIRTQRMIDGMPKDMREDLGWPDRYFEQRGQMTCGQAAHGRKCEG